MQRINHAAPAPLWLRVTNQSEYRAWRTGVNGITRRTQGAVTGYFGSINLLGPREPSMRPQSM